MTTLRYWILTLGTAQAMLGFALAQDIYPIPSPVKFAVAVANVGLLFLLANMRSWGEAKTE